MQVKEVPEYVAQELSSLSATDGEETSYRNGSMQMREVRLEGLGISNFAHG